MTLPNDRRIFDTGYAAADVPSTWSNRPGEMRPLSLETLRQAYAEITGRQMMIQPIVEVFVMPHDMDGVLLDLWPSRVEHHIMRLLHDEEFDGLVAEIVEAVVSNDRLFFDELAQHGLGIEKSLLEEVWQGVRTRKGLDRGGSVPRMPSEDRVAHDEGGQTDAV